MATNIIGSNGIDKIQSGITLNNPVIIKDNIPIYLCRAFGNFDGTKDSTGASSSSNTNRLIIGSGNISSVLRTGTGTFTVTFTTPMPNTNYSVVCSGRYANQANDALDVSASSYTTTTFRIISGYNGDDANGGFGVDPQFLSFAVFG